MMNDFMINIIKVYKFGRNARLFWTQLPNAVYIAAFLCCFAGAVVSALISGARISPKDNPNKTSIMSIVFSILGGVINIMFVGNKLPDVVDAMGFASVLTLFVPIVIIYAASEGVRGRGVEYRRKRESQKKTEEEKRENKQ